MEMEQCRIEKKNRLHLFLVATESRKWPTGVLGNINKYLTHQGGRMVGTVKLVELHNLKDNIITGCKMIVYRKDARRDGAKISRCHTTL